MPAVLVVNPEMPVMNHVAEEEVWRAEDNVNVNAPGDVVVAGEGMANGEIAAVGGEERCMPVQRGAEEAYDERRYWRDELALVGLMNKFIGMLE